MRTKTITTCMIGLALMTGASAQVHHGEITPNGSLYFKAEPVNNYLPVKNDNSDFYYYVHLQGLKKENKITSRMPLNLSVVIDRSGSMDGEKFRYTKEAVKYVVNQLDSRDVISIVLYDTNVEVFLEPQRLENKKELLSRIDKMVTAGSTNLEGGIRKGYELVKNSKKLMGIDMVSRVLLLSDGLANVGLIDPEQLSGITRNFFEKDRISISTFGVGTDYNENLMAKIAGQGGGKYYFINSPENMPSVFNEELKGMSMVIAKNTIVKIKFPADLLAYDKTYIYNSKVNGNELELSFNDIFSEEQKAILIRFKTVGKVKSTVNIECTLSYNNSNDDALLAIADSRKAGITLPVDDKQYKTGYNRAASEGYALQVTGELYENAVEASNGGKYEESKVRIKEAEAVLDNHFKNIGEHPYLKDLYNKLTEYEKLIGEMKNMDSETVRYNIKLYKNKKFRTVSCPAF